VATGFLQCFDGVGWVIWPVKIVPEMTYKVSSGTLNLCSINQYASAPPVQTQVDRYVPLSPISGQRHRQTVSKCATMGTIPLNGQLVTS